MVEMFKLVVMVGNLLITPTQTVYHETLTGCMDAGMKMEKEQPIYAGWRCDAVELPTTAPPK